MYCEGEVDINSSKNSAHIWPVLREMACPNGFIPYRIKSHKTTLYKRLTLIVSYWVKGGLILAYPPEVKTKYGPGRLFKIIGSKVLVEYDYMYLVELPIEDVELSGVDLKNVELLEPPETENVSVDIFQERGDKDEGPLETCNRKRNR